ncbi:MAG: hypothetical protein Ta2C_10860 [Candidatus Endomicrobiellum trichonymphae]|nr:MAG: hypothetical protein Ta2C_10860 [Candidatus Endomicrobium trichonymphae]
MKKLIAGLMCMFMVSQIAFAEERKKISNG